MYTNVGWTCNTKDKSFDINLMAPVERERYNLVQEQACVVHV